MLLLAREIELVQTSFNSVVPIAADFSDLFYARLFELDPTLRPFFSSNLTDQKNKLIHMLQVAVNGLHQLDNISPAVKALGARHVQYGVQDDHYQIFGVALLWTLEQVLGTAFTPEVAAAWRTIYDMLAETAIAGSRLMQFAAFVE